MRHATRSLTPKMTWILTWKSMENACFVLGVKNSSGTATKQEPVRAAPHLGQPKSLSIVYQHQCMFILLSNSGSASLHLFENPVGCLDE